MEMPPDEQVFLWISSENMEADRCRAATNRRAHAQTASLRPGNRGGDSGCLQSCEHVDLTDAHTESIGCPGSYDDNRDGDLL